MEFYVHSAIDAHVKKVKCICIHHRRELIYSIGDDKRLCVSSLTESEQKLMHIKCSNMTPKTMALHQDLNRLYVSMKEGVLFLFDISDTTPVVQHTVSFPYSVSRISIDASINLLQALTKRGSLICLQLSSKAPKQLEPTAYIESLSCLEDDRYKICQVRWLNRPRQSSLNGTYFEGSHKGNLWIRDINCESEKMLKVPCDFADKIKEVHYNGDKNIIFVTSRDGRLKCWKLPNSWGTKEMDDLNAEMEFDKKQELMRQSHSLRPGRR